MLASLTRTQVSELGLLIAGAGTLIIAWGAFTVIRGRDTRRGERIATLIGALVIGIGFLVQIAAFHVTTTVSPTPTPSVSVSATP